MTYASGQRIDAADFNSLATSLNSTWGTGSGVAGYGQAEEGAVAATNIIYGANWASLLNKLNRAYQHQTGGGASGLATTQPATGNVITYFAQVQTIVNYITNASNRTSGAIAGATPTSLNQAGGSGWQATNLTRTMTVSFANTNAMRWFFNANGRVDFGVTWSGGTTAKNADWRDNIVATAGSFYIRNTVAGKLSGGTGLSTSVGYSSLSTANTTYLTDSGADPAYTSNYVQYNVRISGSSLIFSALFVDAAADSDGNDVIDGQPLISAWVYQPATTYLSTASWGTPSIAYA